MLEWLTVVVVVVVSATAVASAFSVCLIVYIQSEATGNTKSSVFGKQKWRQR